MPSLLSLTIVNPWHSSSPVQTLNLYRVEATSIARISDPTLLIMPPPGDILSDPDIAQAYEDVRSDKSETTWLVLKYVSATSDSLKLDKTGTGDIAEMTEALGDDEAAYAYVRVKLENGQPRDTASDGVLRLLAKRCAADLVKEEEDR